MPKLKKIIQLVQSSAKPSRKCSLTSSRKIKKMRNQQNNYICGFTFSAYSHLNCKCCLKNTFIRQNYRVNFWHMNCFHHFQTARVPNNLQRGDGWSSLFHVQSCSKVRRYESWGQQHIHFLPHTNPFML